MSLPGAQSGLNRAEQAGEVCRFPFKQRADVVAGSGPGSSERHDMSDLREGQPEPARLPDERQQPQHVGRIDAIARAGPMRARQDPPRLIEPERLAADSAARGHLPDQQPVAPHEGRIDLAPGGKVKGESNGVRRVSVHLLPPR